MKYLTANLITLRFLLILSKFSSLLRWNFCWKSFLRVNFFSPHWRDERKAIGQSRSCAKADGEKRWKNWEAAYGLQRRCERTCRCSSFWSIFIVIMHRKINKLMLANALSRNILKLIWELKADRNRCKWRKYSDCPYDTLPVKETVNLCGFITRWITLLWRDVLKLKYYSLQVELKENHFNEMKIFSTYSWRREIRLQIHCINNKSAHRPWVCVWIK